MRYLSMKKLFIVSLSLLFSTTLYSQEYTKAIRYSPILENAYKQYQLSQSAKRTSVDTLNLPFFDDFSINSIYPNQLKWIDRNVFINNNFSKQPPSKGVATFDGFNEKGKPYVESEFAYGVCDTLTSAPIDLSYPASDSIYLSFFIQPQGYGRQPAINDSLVLEFLNLNTGKFNKIASWPGAKSYAFKQILIPIKDTLYLKRGFQFRFKNKGSQYGADDHWHLDYVRLNRNRSINDTSILDVSINSNATPLLNPYSSIPWNQFDANLLAENHFVDIKNNFGNSSNVDFTFTSYLDDQKLDSVTKGLFLASGITSNEESKKVIIPARTGPFSVVTTYTASTTNDFINFNDSLISRQNFYNYYAYDDGTAEDGYGITAPANGRFAYEFTTKNEDTLTHVQFHFTQKQVPLVNEIFTLTVWKSLNPEVILYQKTSQEPFYIDSLNGFTTYEIDSILKINGTFYVGWVQATNFFMNIGFDRNSVKSNFMFYKVNALGWQQSSLAGTAMIRPVFADIISTGINQSKAQLNIFNIYPNPGNGNIRLALLNGKQMDNELLVNVINMQGQVVYNGNASQNINIQELSNGMYIIQLRSKDNELLSYQKYLKNE
jgi:hypothetical protein